MFVSLPIFSAYKRALIATATLTGLPVLSGTRAAVPVLSCVAGPAPDGDDGPGRCPAAAS